MSRRSGTITGHFSACAQAHGRYIGTMDDSLLFALRLARGLARAPVAVSLALGLALGLALAVPATGAHAATAVGAAEAAANTAAANAIANAAALDALQPGLAGQVKRLAVDGSRQAAPDPKAPPGRAAGAAQSRVEVALGPLDARLRLAPCQRVEPYLPPGAVLWGKTRVGLRCAQGGTAWNVFVPITVSVFGKAWVAVAPLSAGTVVAAADLVQAEVNLAEDAGMAITDQRNALGRTLARAVNTAQALRQADLKTRQWFAAGDEVQVSARGNGFSVAGAGQALTHGLEGQPARVRVESGRVLVGMPVGERLVELPL